MADTPTIISEEISQDNCYVALTNDLLDAKAIMDKVRSPKAGAIVLFAGTTRDNFNNKPVKELQYQSYIPLALRTMLSISKSMSAKHSLTSVAVIHRLGVVPIGEESILIAVSSPHRQAAWRAGEEMLEEVKEKVEIWKREEFGGPEGGVWRANRDGAMGERVEEPPTTQTQKKSIPMTDEARCFLGGIREPFDALIRKHFEKSMIRNCGFEALMPNPILIEFLRAGFEIETEAALRTILAEWDLFDNLEPIWKIVEQVKQQKDALMGMKENEKPLFPWEKDALEEEREKRVRIQNGDMAEDPKPEWNVYDDLPDRWVIQRPRRRVQGQMYLRLEPTSGNE